MQTQHYEFLPKCTKNDKQQHIRFIAFVSLSPSSKSSAKTHSLFHNQKRKKEIPTQLTLLSDSQDVLTDHGLAVRIHHSLSTLFYSQLWKMARSIETTVLTECSHARMDWAGVFVASAPFRGWKCCIHQKHYWLEWELNTRAKYLLLKAFCYSCNLQLTPILVWRKSSGQHFYFR